jgi:hypothetical protein
MAATIVNAYQTTLSSGITSSATSCSVNNAPPSDLITPFKAVIVAEGLNTTEIVTVTDISGSTFTIARATETWNGSSSASAHAANAMLQVNITAGSVLNIRSYGLDRASFNSTYGDDFTGVSLASKWSRHNQTSGQETYQSGGHASALKVAHGATNIAEYIYQTAPNGTNETWEASVSWFQETTTAQMFGILMVTTAGTGVAAFVYDNGNGLYLGNIVSHNYSSVLSSNQNLKPPPSYYQSGGRLWLRLRKASGLYAASYSLDGEVYSNEVTGTPSAFTPDRIAIGRFLGTNANSVANWHWFDKTA